jgi:hypothetical protein
MNTDERRLKTSGFRVHLRLSAAHLPFSAAPHAPVGLTFPVKPCLTCDLFSIDPNYLSINPIFVRHFRR